MSVNLITTRKCSRDRLIRLLLLLYLIDNVGQIYVFYMNSKHFKLF